MGADFCHSGLPATAARVKEPARNIPQSQHRARRYAAARRHGAAARGAVNSRLASLERATVRGAARCRSVVTGLVSSPLRETIGRAFRHGSLRNRRGARPALSRRCGGATWTLCV
ncbi:hypothetical protein AAFF_G00008970 [Aldrovandia affinis]|uniref:Uncharacterized protein n=1 Tax=Aldrovandia affinis TaxID=143900 RepID=A0AAD7X0S3_9TELE|nr:hypothetical protein AAFF_G00008970 [Aldrovandia affinis]